MVNLTHVHSPSLLTCQEKCCSQKTFPAQCFLSTLLVTNISVELFMFRNLLNYTLYNPSYFFFPLRSYFALHDFQLEKRSSVAMPPFPFCQNFLHNTLQVLFQTPKFSMFQPLMLQAEAQSLFIETHLFTENYLKHMQCFHNQRKCQYPRNQYIFYYMLSPFHSHFLSLSTQRYALLLATTPHPISISLMHTQFTVYSHHGTYFVCTMNIYASFYQQLQFIHSFT